MAKAARRAPQRTCVGCGEVEGKRALLRIVRPPDGPLAADPSGRGHGRGAYVHRDPACIERAIAGRLLRALRAEDRAAELPGLRASVAAALAAPLPRRPMTHRATVPLPDHLIARGRRGPTRTPGRRRPTAGAAGGEGRPGPGL